MSKVKRFSLEERYGYQNRKVIYDKNADNDIELNNIYPIIALLNQLDEQIAYLQHRLEVAEKALELACKYNIPDDEHSHITLRFSDTGVQVESWQELKEYALKQAKKEIKGE